MGTFYLKQMGALARNGSINFGMNQDIQEWTQQNLWKTALKAVWQGSEYALLYEKTINKKFMTSQ